MRALLAIGLMAILTPIVAEAQDSLSNARERGVYLTVFRSPSTGVEVRRNHLGMHAGLYPTVIARNGEKENVNFMRAGITWYLQPGGSTFFATASVVFSLDRDWKHGALTELGYRAKIGNTLFARVGGAVLTTVKGEVRVSPTIGMDLRLGGAR